MADIAISAMSEGKLSGIQIKHLVVARRVSGSTTMLPAELHNSKKIIGAYDFWSEKMYIVPERLDRLSTTINTTIHELAHHESRADDGTKAHEEAVKRISDRVAQEVRAGKYDGCLGGVTW